MKKAYIFNTGCIRRALDSTRIYDYLLKNGWAFTNNISIADLVIIGTCGTIKKNENLSIIAIKKITKKVSKFATVIITGCLPKINPDVINDIGDFIFVPTRDLYKFDEILNSKVKYADTPDVNMVTNDANILNYVLAYRLFRNSYSIKIYSRLSTSGTFLKLCLISSNISNYIKSKLGLVQRQKIIPYYNLRIAEGCLGKCTYCAIRFSTGLLESKPIEKIMIEFKKGLSKGYQYFQLICEDTGCYGLDIGTTIIELLKKMLEIEGDYKIIIIDFGPQWLVKYYDELLPLLKKHHSTIRELFVSLQAGSNKVLKAMKRPYEIESVKEKLIDIKKQIPEINLRTTVIIGFPGETVEDFMKTVDAVQTIDFSEVQLNKYEDRPGTVSEAMDNKVPQKEIERRYRIIKNCR